MSRLYNYYLKAWIYRWTDEAGLQVAVDKNQITSEEKAEIMTHEQK